MWHSSRFSFRILICMLSIMVLFCTFSTFIWYRKSTEEAKRTSLEHMETLLSAQTAMFDENVRDICYTTAVLSNKISSKQNDPLISFLTADTDEAYVTAKQEAKQYLFNRCNFKAYLNGLAVYDFSGNICSYGFVTPYMEASGSGWFQKISSGETEVIYLVPQAVSKDMPLPEINNVFSVIRPVVYSGKIIGVIKADIKCKLLETVFDIQNLSGSCLYVLENETLETIYLSGENNAVGISSLHDTITSQSEYAYFKDQNQSYYGIYETSAMFPWTIAATISENSILAEFIQERSRIVGMVVLCAVVFFCLALLCIRALTSSLRRLTASVEQIDEHMNLPYTIQSKDEIGMLSQKISEMLARIRQLIINNKNAEEEKRQLEIAALSAQINPHFLYNTLNTIKLLSVLQGAGNIRDVTEALSRMLHMNLDTRRFISAEEEISYLKDYLQIQTYRYADKFVYHIHADSDLGRYQVPKLLVQPIVENALKYGTTERINPEVIQINAYAENGKLYFIVKNTGSRFPAELLDGQHFIGAQSKHIGLNNISRRLKLIFGDEAELCITSGDGILTVVELSFPAVPMEEEQK